VFLSQSPNCAAQAAIEARMPVFSAIQHDEDGVAVVIPNAVKAAVLDPRHATAELDVLTQADREAVRDAIITDTLHLFADTDMDDDDGLSVSMCASWPALCGKLRAAPVILDGPAALRWWADLQEADSQKAHRLSPWCRAARMFLSLPAGGAPSESAFSSTSEMVTKKRMRLNDDTLEMMTVVRDYVRLPEFDINELATTLAAHADAAVAAAEGQALADDMDEGDD
jgi:hypothetical protein